MSKPEAEEDGYDPHLHRDVPHGTTNWETAFHCIKGIVGTGILAMPSAFKNCGLINGVLSTILISFVSTLGIHILVNSQYIMCKRLRIPLLRYAESMKIAFEMGPPWIHRFAKYMPCTVNLFLVVHQVGVCCVYVVFIAFNFKSAIDDWLPNPLGVELYVMMIMVPLLLMLLIKDLKMMAPFSLVANIIALATFGVLGYYLSKNMPHIGHAAYFANPLKYPLFFGTTLFALLAIGVVISAENNMLTPKYFGGWFGVLNISMFFVTILYTFVGFVGYWRFGKDTKDSITLNFPREEILAKVITIMYAISIFVSFGLQGYVGIEILWFQYMQPSLTKSPHQKLWEYVLRVGFFALSVALACSIPLLGLGISLVGAFCFSALALMFPAMIEMCVTWPNARVTTLCKDIFLIVFGLFGLVVGSGTTIYEMVLAMRKLNQDPEVEARIGIDDGANFALYL